MANHYYIPVILSETEKIDYINHIIKVKSEVEFLQKLEDYLSKSDNVFTKFDWWMFSKLDETLDKVYIPYYNPNENRLAEFKPDFIFWMQKGNSYLILFVDPKGTEYTNGFRKIDGYSRLFENPISKRCKNFQFSGNIVNVKLLLYTDKKIANVINQYKRYWFDFADFEVKVTDGVV